MFLMPISIPGGLFNSSCRPNARFEPFFDGRQYIMMIVSEKNIKAGSEILVHYGFSFFEEASIQEARKLCYRICMCLQQVYIPA